MHLKRLAAPKFFPIQRKHGKYVVCPSPGPHPKEFCFPLLLIVRDILGIAEKAKEAKKIIKAREILVDGRVRTDHKFPVGLFDVISIPKIGKNYLVVPSKKGLELREIEEKDAKEKLCKIIGKKMVKGNKVQITLHDGKTFLVGIEEKDKFKVGDTVKVKLNPEKYEVKEIIEYKEGARVVVIRGANIGKLGRIIKPIKRRRLEKQKVLVEVEGREIILPKSYVFVLPDNFEI